MLSEKIFLDTSVTNNRIVIILREQSKMVKKRFFLIFYILVTSFPNNLVLFYQCKLLFNLIISYYESFKESFNW